MGRPSRGPRGFAGEGMPDVDVEAAGMRTGGGIVLVPAGRAAVAGSGGGAGRARGACGAAAGAPGTPLRAIDSAARMSPADGKRCLRSFSSARFTTATTAAGISGAQRRTGIGCLCTTW